MTRGLLYTRGIVCVSVYCIAVFCVVCFFWVFFTFVAYFPSVGLLWYCWLGLLTCKTVCHITYTVLVETLKQQTSPNHELLVDCLRDRCNSNKTKIVWILQFCFIKVLTIGISRNELPIFVIVLPIPIQYNPVLHMISTSIFLPARRYATAGYSDRNVSVCPSVRHAPVLCQNEES